MSEADRYRQVPLWGDRIYSYEDISAPQAQNQSKDSTLEHIRSRLDFKPPSMDTRQEGHKRFRDDPDLDLVCVTDSGNKTTFLDSYDGDLVSRVHTQITHTYTGHLLLHFKNLRELLQVILDVVKGKRLPVPTGLNFLTTIKNTSTYITKAAYFTVTSAVKTSL